jgi:hypothetical protein
MEGVMRLFHVSEESDISIFTPRIPKRKDIDNSKGLVWAITEACLPNFLVPRDCPRVAYYATDESNEQDIEKFFADKRTPYVLAIEQKWFDLMMETTLYVYEFNIDDFYLQDKTAGYYVSEVEQVPINKYIVTDIVKELFTRNVELRILPNLWSLGEKIKASLQWSLCRMRNAQKAY